MDSNHRFRVEIGCGFRGVIIEKALAGALSSLPAVLPALNAPLMARLDRLDPAPKEVAQIAAAIEREFSIGADRRSR